MKKFLSKISVAFLATILLLNFLAVVEVFAQNLDLSRVRLTVTPSASPVIAGETEVTFRVSGAPGGGLEPCVVAPDFNGCLPNTDALGTSSETVKLPDPGVFTYSLTINGQAAPSATANLTVVAAVGAGSKGIGESCTGDNQCSSGKCDSQGGVCAASGVTVDTGDGGGTGGGNGTGGSTGGASSNCGNDPNLRWDATAKICLPANSTCTAGSLACEGTLSGLILKIINYLLIFAGMIAVLFIIVGGFWYITAAGNEEQSEKGKKALMNAVIGLVVVSLAFLIVRIVSNTLNSTNFGK